VNAHLPPEETDAVVRLSGPVLSTRAAQSLCNELARLARESGRPLLRLDLAGVEYLTAAGLSKLLDLRARLRAAGGGLLLANAGGCLGLSRLCGVPDAYLAGISQPA
jgi:anti-anti-sigma regulatory factor